MLGALNAWLQSLGHKQSTILARLSKQAVRDHQNVRLGGEGNSPTSHGTFASNSGSQMHGNSPNYLQGIPGVTQAHGLYNQFGGGPGGRREFGPPGTIGTMPGPEAGPPTVPVSSRPGGGYADNFYGDTSDPFPSQHYASYPGGPSSGVAPLSRCIIHRVLRNAPFTASSALPAPTS
jgi:hypothetical protein